MRGGTHHTNPRQTVSWPGPRPCSLSTLTHPRARSPARPRRRASTRWLAGGTSYTALEVPEGGEEGERAVGGGESSHDSTIVVKQVREIVQYDAKTGAKTTLVDLAALTPPDSEQPLDIQDYWWSDDGAQLLVFTNTTKVWRQNTRGDYYVVDVLGGAPIKQVGGGAEAQCLMYAKFSPGGGAKVGYVLHNNVYVQDMTTMGVVQLTTDGLPGHGGMAPTINGNFDWVYEEELSVKDGWRWSPDGRKISYWQLQTEKVQWYSLYDTTSQAPYSKVTTYPYPKVGTDNPTARVGVVGCEGGPTTWMALEPADGGEHYIARMEWAASSAELVIQRIPREQKVNDVLLADVSTGKATVVLSEADECWVGAEDNLKWVGGGTHFTWLSERSGFTHLYLVARDGGSLVDLTAGLGEADVISIVAIDDTSGQVYFIAAPGTPLERYLFVASLEPAAGGAVRRVTPEGPEHVGTHRCLVPAACGRRRRSLPPAFSLPALWLSCESAGFLAVRSSRLPCLCL
eukprot:SAG22_NODE_784_length_7228_cov_10.581620_5_plen_514_part_00